MYKQYLMLSLVAGLLLAAGQALAAPVAFTGNVANDFSGTGLFYLDPGGGLEDVSLPTGIASSGNAIIQLAVAYDTLSDTLCVGIDTVGIALDVDGDGRPGRASRALKKLGGKDYKKGGVAESFTFSLDLDNDGIFDIIAGIDLRGKMTSGYKVRAFSGDTSAPYYAFGDRISGLGGKMSHDPSAAKPDLEFTITGLKGYYSAFDWTNLHMQAFVGSLRDAGIGEDFMEVFAAPPLPAFIDDDTGDNFMEVAIPEPSSIIVAGGALALLTGIIRKRMAV